MPGTIIVSSIMSITVTNLTGTTNFTTSNDYANGKTISNYAAVAIKSNVLWVLSISSQSANFSPQSTGASTNMPASILGMRVNGTSSFLTMSTSSQTLKTGGRGNAAVVLGAFVAHASKVDGAVLSDLQTVGHEGRLGNEKLLLSARDGHGADLSVHHVEEDEMILIGSHADRLELLVGHGWMGLGER